MSVLPKLYHRTKTGKTMSWEIVCEHDHYYTRSQYLPDGKVKVSEKTYCTPKNVGKKNETTTQQQVLHQAQSLWNKKKQQQFTKHLPSTEQKKDTSYIRPMLAQAWTLKKKLPTVFGVSPKLDGIRAVAHDDRLYSRNGLPFIFLTHLKSQLKTLFQHLPSKVILDGELYIHHHTFNELTKIVRPSKTPSPHDAEIQYWVFDIVSPEPYTKRMEQMREVQCVYERLFSDSQTLQFIYSTPIELKELESYHAQFVEQGYEGSILRVLEAPYQVGVRSSALLKYKSFEDAEFEIVAYKEGSGADAQTIIFQCRTRQGKVFFVRPKGSVEYRRELLLKGEDYLGKRLTVRYQELSEEGVPRFPVGIAVRDYE